MCSVLLKMDKIEEIEVLEVGDIDGLGVTNRKDEESFIDENVEIFDTILLNETIETTKGKMEALKDQCSDTCGVFRSFFHFFYVNQSPHCPEFVEWCANSFFATKGVIMNKSKSKIHCPVQAPSIR